MSARRNHLIGTALFDLELAQPDPGPRADSDRVRYLRDRILPLAASVLDEFSDAATIRRVERLEVDLGTEALGSPEFEHRFRQELRAALRGSFGAAPGGSTRREEGTRTPGDPPRSGGGGSELEALGHILRTGTLPWTLDGRDEQVLDTLARRLLRDDPAGLAHVLRAARAEPRMLDRFVRQVDDDTLSEALGLLAGSPAAGWREVLSRLDTLARVGGASGAVRAGLRRALGLALLGAPIRPAPDAGTRAPVARDDLPPEAARLYREIVGRFSPSIRPAGGDAAWTGSVEGSEPAGMSAPVGSDAAWTDLAVRGDAVRTPPPDGSPRTGTPLPAEFARILESALASGELDPVLDLLPGWLDAHTVDVASRIRRGARRARVRQMLIRSLPPAILARLVELLAPGATPSSLPAGIPSGSGGSRAAGAPGEATGGPRDEMTWDFILAHLALDTPFRFRHGAAHEAHDTPSPIRHGALRDAVAARRAALEPAESEPTSLLRGYELGDALLQAFRHPEPAPEPLVAQLYRHHPDRLFALIRAFIHAGEAPGVPLSGGEADTPHRPAADTLQRLVESCLLASGRDPAATLELRSALGIAGARAVDRRSFFLDVLWLVVDREPIDLEVLRLRHEVSAHETSAHEAPVHNASVPGPPHPELRHPGSRRSESQQPRPQHPRSQHPESPPAPSQPPARSPLAAPLPADPAPRTPGAQQVPLERLMEWASRPTADPRLEGARIRSTVAQALDEDPVGLRPVLEHVLQDGRTAALLVDALPDALLARVFLLLRPGAVGSLLPGADALVAALPREWRATAPPDRVKWRFLARYLVEDGRLPQPTPFLRDLLAELARHGAEEGKSEAYRRVILARLEDGAASRETSRAAFRDAASEALAALVRTETLHSGSPRVGAHEGADADAPAAPPDATRIGVPPESPPRPARSEDPVTGALEDTFLLLNAGLVLLGPFLPRLFSVLELTREGEFRSPEAEERAVHLTQCLVDERPDRPEPFLLLNKILCGLPLERPIPRRIEVTPQESEAVRHLLEGVLVHWGALGNTSVNGLRESFLQRRGFLRRDPDAWRLEVEPKAFDMLLDRVPWGFATIRLRWMDRPLRVEWR